MRVMQGLEPLRPPYTLNDMARDAVGLLDALGIASAHLVGASMGGMIAQLVAIEHPERVRTLTSIMSTTGEPGLPPGKPEVYAAISAPPPLTVADYIETNVRVAELLRSYRRPAGGSRRPDALDARRRSRPQPRRRRAPTGGGPGGQQPQGGACERQGADAGDPRLR